MKLSRFDRTLLLALGLAFIAACFLASGCTTQAEWQASIMSTRLGYEIGDGSYNSRGDKATNDTDYQALTVSIQPFQLWAWKAQADIQARASVEAQYAERPPPPGPVLPVGPPTPCVEKPK